VGQLDADALAQGGHPEAPTVTRLVAPVVLGAALLAVAASATPEWSPPARLSTSFRAIGPELALSRSGHGVVVWDREEGAECVSSPASLGCVHILTSRSRTATGWTPELEVNRPGVGAAPTAATNDAGNEAVLWVHDIGADRVLQAVFRPSSGSPFPNAEDLSKDVQEVRDHAIAMDAAGNLVAVWAQRLGTQLTVETEWRPRATGAWSAASPLSPSGLDGGFFGPALKVNPAGGAVAAWVESGVVVAALGNVATQIWAPREPLSSVTGLGEGDPSVAIDDAGDTAVTWAWLGGTSEHPVVQAAYRPRGGQWEVRTLGDADGSVPPHPRAALDGGGNATFVWIGGTGATSLETAGRTSAGIWSQQSTIVASGASDPELAVDPQGRAVVVWRNQGTRRIEASIRPGAAAAWQPRAFVSPADPSIDAVDASFPRVGIDGDGHAVATWQRGTGQSSIESSELGGSWAPTLENTRRPAVRGRARVGARLLCDPGAWDGTIPIAVAYRWLRDGRAVRGARGRSYAVRRPDRGRLLACRVTATNPGGPLSATSRAVRVRR
jgi:hypothetical protein